jgi:hypothetical protein
VGLMGAGLLGLAKAALFITLAVVIVQQVDS